MSIPAIPKDYYGHKTELFLDNLCNQESDNLRDHKHYFDVMLIVFLHFSLFFMKQNILNRNIFSIFLIPLKKMADINHLFSSYI